MTFSAFQFHNPVKIVYGIDCINQLPEEVSALCPDEKSIVIVTDPGIAAVGLADKVKQILENAGYKVNLFSDVESDPSFDTVDKAVEVIKVSKSNCVIGLGGGSAIDTAKLASVAFSDNLKAETYALTYDFQIPPLPKSVKTIAIPTTAGTGAEVTAVGVYSTSDKDKCWTSGYRLTPETALLDPALTLGLPASLTAATGLDALVHAIEATAGKLGNNPMVQAFGMQAIQLICRSLENAVKNPENLEARGDMMLGATLAGMAIDAGDTAMAHGMGHALGTIGGIHHGRAVALCLDAFYSWNVEACPDVHSKIAQAMGIDISGKTSLEAGMAGAEEFSRLLSQVGLPLSLKPDGLDAKDLDRFVESIYSPGNLPLIDFNYREPEKEDIVKFARAVLER